MRGLRIALGLIGVFGLSATAAADPAFYVGGGVGQYNIKIDGNNYTPPAESSTAEANLGGNFEDSAAVWGVFGGYQFNKYLGLQADYVMLRRHADLRSRRQQPQRQGQRRCMGSCSTPVAAPSASTSKCSAGSAGTGTTSTGRPSTSKVNPTATTRFWTRVVRSSSSRRPSA